MVKKGEELSVDILSLNSEGKGISKTDEGFVVFSEKTLPGDRAIVRILRKKPNYAEAVLQKIEIPSVYRTDPPCLHFGVCGGCKIQNYDYGQQLKFKRNVVKDAFERIGKFEGIKIPDTVSSERTFYYRNKMEFSFSDDEWMTEVNSGIEKGNFALGLHVPKFHSKILRIDRCFLQSELSNGILNFTGNFFKSRNIPVYSTRTNSGFLRFLIIRQSFNTEDLMVNLITYDYDERLMQEYTSSLISEFQSVTTVINSVSEKKAQVATGEKEIVLYGSGYITEILKRGMKNFSFRISPQSFFQTNTLQAEKLFNIVTEFADFGNEDNVLDLYCGTGSISLFISDLVNTVTGAELIQDSVIDAVRNAELNRADNCRFICTDIRDFLLNKSENDNYDKLILDPPRAGLHPEICRILSETKFTKMLYVSCNPHTQARDLQIICSRDNYKIDRIQPVDMFPHTYHVENVVSLSVK